MRILGSRPVVVLAGSLALAAGALLLPRIARSADEDPQVKTYAELKDAMWTINQGPESTRGWLVTAFNKASLDEDEWAAVKGRTAMLCEITNWMIKAKPPLNGDTPAGLAKWKKHIADYRADAEATRAAAQKQDLAAGKTALASLGKRCTECHDDHRKEE